MRTCRVSFTDADGTKHSVEVTAESLMEAAVIGLNQLRKDQWTADIGPASRLEIEVHEPTVRHVLSIKQLNSWFEGAVTNPADLVRKKRLKMLLAL